MITIVGCGPGSADYLTLAARNAINSADILIGAPRLLALRTDTEVERITVSTRIDDVIRSIEARHADGVGRQITVLVSGDPGIFSLARRVILAFGREQCTVIPGISSVQTAFARLGLPWDDARIVSAHHLLPDIQSIEIDSTGKLAILSGREDVVEWLRALLERFGEGVSTFACENLTMENECVRELTEEDLKDGSFESRCVFVVVRKECLK